MRFVLLLLASTMVFPNQVFAHAEGNAIEDGNYRVELSSFPEEDLQPFETIIFSVVLEDLEAEPIYETKAWVRISKNDQILFSSADLQTTDGTVDFEYLFPDHGDYEMTVRLVNLENEDEASVTFPLTIGDLSLVEEVTKEEQRIQRESNFNLSVLTLIIGLLSGVFLARYRPKKNGIIEKRS